MPDKDGSTRHFDIYSFLKKSGREVRNASFTKFYFSFMQVYSDR